MTAEVVPLRRPAAKDAFFEALDAQGEPQQIVWECSCGCQLFFLQRSGAIECRDCGTWLSACWSASEPMGAA